jgi:hypothetical protein
MIRLVFRFLALIALAVATIMLVLDATRTIAVSALVVTPLGESWASALPNSYALAEAKVRTYISPVAWDPVALTVLKLPGFAVFAVLALIFYAIGRRRNRRPSGFVEV